MIPYTETNGCTPRAHLAATGFALVFRAALCLVLVAGVFWVIGEVMP